MKNVVPLENVIAPAVFVAAGVGGVVFWGHYTDLPFWITAILGIISGGLAVMAIVLILTTISRKKGP